jgi:hypothetical protein
MEEKTLTCIRSGTKCILDREKLLYEELKRIRRE